MKRKEYEEMIDKLINNCDDLTRIIFKLKEDIKLRDSIIDKQQELLKYYGCKIEL